MKDRSEESFTAELRAIFLAEAADMLEDTESAFMEIEADPADKPKIDKIFRLVHTIKGSAHVAGFKQVGDFAHAFETLIGALREGKLAISSDVVDLLLAGNDTLRKCVADLKQDAEALLDTSGVEARIRAIVGGGADATKAVRQPTDARQAPAVPVSTASAPARPVVTRRTFLVCDDEPEILELLATVLESGGYDVVGAKSAAEALALMKHRAVDVVMTDLRMPGMDGLEFVKALRRVNRLMPVVVISGHTSREHLKAFLGVGVDEFVDKPFEPDQLLVVASRVLRTRILRESLLAVSRFSFRAYVAMQKMEALRASGADPATLEREQQFLDESMNEMRLATMTLLEAERAIKGDD